MAPDKCILSDSDFLTLLERELAGIHVLNVLVPTLFFIVPSRDFPIAVGSDSESDTDILVDLTGPRPVEYSLERPRSEIRTPKKGVFFQNIFIVPFSFQKLCSLMKTLILLNRVRDSIRASF